MGSRLPLTRMESTFLARICHRLPLKKVRSGEHVQWLVLWLQPRLDAGRTADLQCDGDWRGWTGAGWSVQQAIDSLVRKAGFRGEVTAAIRRTLTVTRYQSTTFTLTFEEYRHARRSMDDRVARQQIIGNSPPNLSTDGATSTRRKFGLCGW
jgi:hypothetical protein